MTTEVAAETQNVRSMLKTKLRRQGESFSDLTKQMGFSNYGTMKRKIDGVTPLTLDQAIWLANYLGISCEELHERLPGKSGGTHE